MTLRLFQASRVFAGTAFFLLILDRGLKILSADYQTAWGGMRFERYVNEKYLLAVPVPTVWGQVMVSLLFVALLFYAVSISRARPRRLNGSWFLILGAASNVYDRLVYGAVVDYWQVGVLPVINVADIMIVVGVLGWLHLKFEQA